MRLNGRILLGIFTAIVFHTNLAEAIVIRHDRDDAAYLELAKQFPATGRVVPDGGCALIQSRWVLTAGHVARSLSPFGAAVSFGGKEYEIDYVRLHPKRAFKWRSATRG